VVTVLNQIYEVDFLGFSYGFRPGRGAHDALDALWMGIMGKKVNWVLDADIQSFFDTISLEWLVKFLEHRIADRRLLRLIQKWLQAGVSEAGQWTRSEVGTPPGAVASPLLANLFMHYAFDAWMRRTYPGILLERYADDVIIHDKSHAQAQQVLAAVRQRLRECRLELHPEKTKIVYCQDSDRKGQHEHIKFDFLGYTFRPRRAKNRWGKFFVSFLPAISTKAAQAIQETIRNWRLAATRNNQSLEDIARLVNPSVRGWVNYYGRFYRSALTPALRHLERALVRWACRKYKRLRRHYPNAAHWLGRVARRAPQLFVHWQVGIRPATGS
jgi:RNA-directed DNA polymerase